jgi:hypothetical protein
LKGGGHGLKYTGLAHASRKLRAEFNARRRVSAIKYLRANIKEAEILCASIHTNMHTAYHAMLA